MNGPSLRDAGCERVATNNPDWTESAAAVVRRLASTGAEFTSDDVRCLLPAPPHPNCLGAAFRVVSQERVIRRVGYRQATTASAHARVVGVWRGASLDHARAIANLYDDGGAR